jgi:hypothetical protein
LASENIINQLDKPMTPVTDILRFPILN